MGSFDVLLYAVLHWAVVALALWALVDALMRPAPAYVAAGKLTKPAWAGITALALAIAYFMQPLAGFFWVPAVVASAVYLVDVRPALKGLRRGNSNNW